jgi:hypothetical protein
MWFCQSDGVQRRHKHKLLPGIIQRNGEVMKKGMDQGLPSHAQTTTNNKQDKKIHF